MRGLFSIADAVSDTTAAISALEEDMGRLDVGIAEAEERARRLAEEQDAIDDMRRQTADTWAQTQDTYASAARAYAEAAENYDKAAESESSTGVWWLLLGALVVTAFVIDQGSK